MENWRQFKDFMPPEIIGLFEGTYFWKMPAEVEMDVGQTIIYPLPQWYVEATEKYGSQTRVLHLPDGSYEIGYYVGGISILGAGYVGDERILAQTDLAAADGNFPANYDMPLGWGRPSCGRWSVRDVYIIDVRRIPSEQASYCNGRRVMYVDQHLYHPLWEEIFDSNMKLWKLVHIGIRPQKDPVTGEMVPVNGAIIEQYWDIQNEHQSQVFTTDAKGRDIVFDGGASKQYDDVERYSTPGGLMRIVR